MFNHHLKDMSDMIDKDKSLTMKQRVRIYKTMQKYWDDKIAIVWTVKDVISEAKHNHKRCSKDTAMEILGDLHQNHDANFGITWSAIRECLGV